MRRKPNVVREAINPSIAKHNIDTVSITDKPQASKRKNINSSEINQTKVHHWINQCHWINQGLLKEPKQNTQ